MTVNSLEFVNIDQNNLAVCQKKCPATEEKQYHSIGADSRSAQ